MASDTLLIRNARIFTADPTRPWAEAVGLHGNRIAFIGSNAEAEHWRTATTRVIDGGQASLTPGIVDSHYHLFFGSMELGHVQLWDAQSLADVSELVRAYAAAHPDEESVNCVQFRYEILPPGERLTRQHLDAMLPDRPLLIMGYDHHTAWGNTRALEIAGVLHGAVTGPNSEILMGDDGLATGELVEPAAYAVVLRHFEAWGRTVKGLINGTAGAVKLNAVRERRWLLEGLKLSASLGITSVHNMDGDLEQGLFYAAMEDSGDLSVRVNIPYSIFPTTTVEDLQEAVEMTRRFQSEKLRSGRVKLFMDGVMESWTALMLDDYADRPGWAGDALYSADHFNWLAQECDARGLQITVHAIGDAAVRRTLDGYELAAQTNGIRDSRHRIEHIECVHPDDLPRFARLGVVASMQPYHSPITYPQTHELFPSRVGAARWDRSFAWQNVRGAGAHLAFGSDWPVVTPDPMIGMHAALNRRTWGPGAFDHRQSLADTLISYTREGAYAEFQEHARGQVKVGMLADLVLFSADLFATPPEEITKVRPMLTICDGQITYEA
ncbi:MAG: amidohydrolase [Chloroflexi bacterium]|uniref:amidohydrolase n=1 Tax=Candidatus Flexifilum breve TaxID=3140694 RepID=UPI00313695E4|nr:amidohydrolase [Chloroflexota bacterium]